MDTRIRSTRRPAGLPSRRATPARSVPRQRILRLTSPWKSTASPEPLPGIAPRPFPPTSPGHAGPCAKILRDAYRSEGIAAGANARSEARGAGGAARAVSPADCGSGRAGRSRARGADQNAGGTDRQPEGSQETGAGRGGLERKSPEVQGPERAGENERGVPRPGSRNRRGGSRDSQGRRHGARAHGGERGARPPGEGGREGAGGDRSDNEGREAADRGRARGNDRSADRAA